MRGTGHPGTHRETAHTGCQQQKSYVEAGDLLSVQRLGHGQLPGDGVDDEDARGRLVGAGPGDAVPQREVFVSVGPDLRVQTTIPLEERPRERVTRDTACHASRPSAVTNPHHRLPETQERSQPGPGPAFLATGFKKRCARHDANVRQHGPWKQRPMST